MTIRPELPSDRESVYLVHAAAFPSDDEARLVDVLRDAGCLTVSLVAEESGRVVGHTALSPVSVAGTSGGLGLAPIAIMPEYQRQGIGSRLVQAALAAAAEKGAGFVVVLGAPGYYGRFGFTAATGWELTDEFGGGAAFQAIELVAGAIPRNGGLVRYAAEFALVAG